MKAIKFLLLSVLAFGLVFGWMQWRGRVQVGALSSHQAGDKGWSLVSTSEPIRYSYNEYDPPPKLDAPDGIKATVDPGESSPFANDNS